MTLVAAYFNLFSKYKLRSLRLSLLLVGNRLFVSYKKKKQSWGRKFQEGPDWLPFQ